MTHIPIANQQNLNHTPIKSGIIFGDREGAPDHGDGTDSNVFFAVIGGTGGNVLYMTRGLEGDIVKWDLDDPYELPAITPKGLSTRESENPAVYGSVGANFLLGYLAHLILANTKEISVNADGETTEYFPFRVRWSSFADPENFRIAIDTTGGYVDLLEDEANAPVLSIFRLREILVAYKGNSIYNLTAGTSELFTADMIVAERGILSAKAVAPVFDGNRHLIVSHDNFYIYDGFQITDPVNPTGERIRDYFYKNFDYSKTESLFVASFPSLSQCWIFFETIQHNREAICWDWEEDSWTRHENLPMRCARVVTSLAGGEDVVFAGAMDGKTADPAEATERGDTDHHGVVRLFGEQNDPYLRDRLNRISEGVDEETIEAGVDLPATPLIVKSKRGEDRGIRMRRQTLKSVTVEMDVGLPDIKDETFETEFDELRDAGRVQVFGKRSDNLTLPVTKSEEPLAMIDKSQHLESNRYIFEVGDLDVQLGKAEYVGVSLEFVSPNYLEELGQVIEEVDGSDPYS